MNFDFSPEQEMVRQSLRKALRTYSDRTAIRTAMEQRNPVSDELWTKLGELGMLGLALPEAYGGTGGDMVDLAVLLEELGCFLVPGPYLETLVVLPAVLQLAGTEEQRQRYLPSVAAGTLRCALAFLEEEPQWDEQGLVMTVGSDRLLHGRKHLVTWAEQSDLMLVATREQTGGLSLFLVAPDADGVDLTLVPSTDPLSRQYVVRFSGAVGELVGTRGECRAALIDALNQAAAAASLDLLGNARRVLEMTVEYAKQREQFGRPIGSFQALKHSMADMHICVENGSSTAYYAAMAVANRQEDLPLAVSRAKAFTSDMGRWMAQRGIQLHGGIGFTWEHDMHLRLKRALRFEMAYGNGAIHRDRIADLRFGPASAG